MVNNSSSATETANKAKLPLFLITLTIYVTIAVVEIIIFVIIKTKFKRIYESKTYLGEGEPPSKNLPKTLSDWLWILLKMPTEELINSSGLDAYFFARYLYIHARFFLISFVVLGIILLPIYSIGGKGVDYDKKGRDQLTFGNISPSHTYRYVAPLVLAYVFILAFLRTLYNENKVFVEKRQALLRSPAYQSRTSATTVLVTAIPKEYRSQDKLFEIYNQLPGGVKYIWLSRDPKRRRDKRERCCMVCCGKVCCSGEVNLPNKVDERMKLIEELETIECKMIKDVLRKKAKHLEKHNKGMQPVPTEEPNEQSSVPEKVTHYKKEIVKLNSEIEDAQTAVENNNEFMSFAFIQFNTLIAAHIAKQSVAASFPSTMTRRYIDVKPANIVWENLNLSEGERKGRKFLALLFAAIPIIIWTALTSFVGAISSARYLTTEAPFLRCIGQLPVFRLISHTKSLPTILLTLVTSALPTILLAIVTVALPHILKEIAKISGVPTTDRIDCHVQGSYFAFQVVHVFLFVSISSSIANVVSSIVKNPSSVATILAINIPTASNFFFGYLAFQGLAMAAGVVLRISPLLKYLLWGKFRDNTPRKKWARQSDSSRVSWGMIYPAFTNFVVITLVYSIISPITLLIAGLAFGTFYIAYTYIFFYISSFSSDTGGLSFPRAIHQSFVGIYLMETMLGGLFLLAQNEIKSRSAVVEAVLMFVLIGITIAVQFTMKSSFDPLTYYFPIDGEKFSKEETSVSKKPAEAEITMKIENVSEATSSSADAISNTNNVTTDSQNNIFKNMYLHPAMRRSKPVIWIPKDNSCIAEEEVRETETSEWNLRMSFKGADITDEGKIQVRSPPPEHVETMETNSLNSV